MKISHVIMGLVIVTVGISIVATPVLAGNVQRNRWEGVAIGIGAAILGHALINEYRQPVSRPEAVYRHSPARRDKPRSHRSPRGYWDVRKTWVAPAYERTWNPGHYDRRGRWVSGHWIEIEKASGYWTEERVWVSVKGRHR